MAPFASQIRAGSFRGAPFLWQDHQADIGRRVVLHEFPKRDKPFAEDMGRKARQFTLDVFVQGANWVSQRDALMTALEAEGPGTLIHPNFGTMQVSVMPPCRVSESWQTLGRADFSITFVESGDISFAASSVPQPGSQVTDAASSSNAACQASFASSFSTSSSPSWVGGAATSDLSNALSKVKSFAAAVAGAAATSLATVTGAVNTVEGTISTLLAAPVALASAIGGAISSVSQLAAFGASSWDDIFDAVADDIDAALALPAILAAQLGITTIGTTTAMPLSVTPAPAASASDPDRVQQAANTAAIFALVRQSALAEAAQGAVAATYDSANDAATARDQVTAAIDAEMLIASDDTVVQALQALRLATARELDAIAAQLPTLSTWTPPMTVPAIAAAHRLYDDPSWAEDIVARNDIRHPLFVPGGIPLEILGSA